MYVPSNVPEQMSFFEFYSTGMPLFIPAHPDLYLFPRLDIFADSKSNLCTHGRWLEKHQLEFNSTGARLAVNYTFSCSGRCVSRQQAQKV